jgi:hypothetical protein
VKTTDHQASTEIAGVSRNRANKENPTESHAGINNAFAMHVSGIQALSGNKDRFGISSPVTFRLKSVECIY